MEILLVERDHLVRDQVKVGLQQFPEFTVTWGEGYAAINELRQRDYDVVFLGMPEKLEEGIRLLEQLRSFDRTTELVVIATDRQSRDMANEKARSNITAFLHRPLSASDFFRMVARLLERRQESEVTRAAAAAGSRVSR